jgi:hypothetical protein
VIDQRIDRHDHIHIWIAKGHADKFGYEARVDVVVIMQENKIIAKSCVNALGAVRGEGNRHIVSPEPSATI